MCALLTRSIDMFGQAKLTLFMRAYFAFLLFESAIAQFQFPLDQSYVQRQQPSRRYIPDLFNSHSSQLRKSGPIDQNAAHMTGHEKSNPSTARIQKDDKSYQSNDPLLQDATSDFNKAHIERDDTSIENSINLYRESPNTAHNQRDYSPYLNTVQVQRNEILDTNIGPAQMDDTANLNIAEVKKDDTNQNSAHDHPDDASKPKSSQVQKDDRSDQKIPNFDRNGILDSNKRQLLVDSISNRYQSTPQFQQIEPNNINNLQLFDASDINNRQLIQQNAIIGQNMYPNAANYYNTFDNTRLPNGIDNAKIKFLNLNQNTLKSNFEIEGETNWNTARESDGIANWNNPSESGGITNWNMHGDLDGITNWNMHGDVDGITDWNLAQPDDQISDYNMPRLVDGFTDTNIHQSVDDATYLQNLQFTKPPEIMSMHIPQQSMSSNKPSHELPVQDDIKKPNVLTFLSKVQLPRDINIFPQSTLKPSSLSFILPLADLVKLRSTYFILIHSIKAIPLVTNFQSLLGIDNKNKLSSYQQSNSKQTLQKIPKKVLKYKVNKYGENTMLQGNQLKLHNDLYGDFSQPSFETFSHQKIPKYLIKKPNEQLKPFDIAEQLPINPGFDIHSMFPLSVSESTKDNGPVHEFERFEHSTEDIFTLPSKTHKLRQKEYIKKNPTQRNQPPKSGDEKYTGNSGPGEEQTDESLSEEEQNTSSEVGLDKPTRDFRMADKFYEYICPKTYYFDYNEHTCISVIPATPVTYGKSLPSNALRYTLKSRSAPKNYGVL